MQITSEAVANVGVGAANRRMNLKRLHGNTCDISEIRRRTVLDVKL